MQLFRIAWMIKVVDPLWWNYMIIQPGRMHTLISFLGSIGNLMKVTGLDMLLHSAFSGIHNMINVKQSMDKSIEGI